MVDDDPKRHRMEVLSSTSFSTRIRTDPQPFLWEQISDLPYMRAGFVIVTEKLIAVLIKTWPKDEGPKDEGPEEIGRWLHVHLPNGLQEFTVKLSTQFLGKSEEGVEVVLTQVRKDLGDRKIHAYLRVIFVTGQKPLA